MPSLDSFIGEELAQSPYHELRSKYEALCTELDAIEEGPEELTQYRALRTKYLQQG